MTKHFDYRPDIDGLRAVAVLSVVLFHYGAEFLPGGFTGVDIFFTISGFLITRILSVDFEKGTFSLSRFYARRVRRIAPALLVVLFSSMAAGWFVMSPQDYENLTESAAFASLGLANVFFYLNTGYFDRAADNQPLLHTWSLGVEEQFYLVWPLVLLAVMSAFRSQCSRRWLILGLVLVGFSYAVFAVARNHTYAFYLPHPRAWELCLGGLIAFLPPIRADLPRQGLAFSGIVLVAYSLLVVSSNEPFPGWNALYACLGAALLIASGGRERATFVGHILSLRPLVSVGLISYSMYLWHWPILVMMGHLHHGFLLVMTCVLSVATYWFIERPGRHLNSAWIPLIATGFCVVAGLAISINKGFPWRLPAQQQELARFDYDNFADWRITRCFLNPEQAQFAPECEDPPAGKDLPKIALWGDSLAAHIYPGLADYAKASGMSVMQFTGSLCPPFLRPGLIFDRPNCLSTNRQALEAIERQKPAVVFLSGAWFHYLSKFPPGENLVSALKTTIESLKRAGVERVYLIGPFPGWNEPLPKVLMSHLNEFGTIPNRTNYKLNLDILAQDPVIRNIASSLGVKFISAIDAMCNVEGCLTKTGRSVETITAFDIGHLTAAGAAYLIERISGEVNWHRNSRL